MNEFSIGVDLGGTNLRAAAVTRSGEVLEKIAGASKFTEGRAAVLADMADSICRLRDRYGANRLTGVGIGVPGFIVLETGTVIGSNNLSVFDGTPIRDEIEELVETPVFLENDANAAALGEMWMGAGKGVSDLVLVALGTGVGGGIVSGGKILHGQIGMAGELGHMTVVPNGNPCGCGNRGCLEKHASATAISSMAKLLRLGSEMTAADVYHLALTGNERARMIFEGMGEALGIALANLINIFNFPLYLLSGGPLGAWELFAPVMINEVRKRSFTYRNTQTRIERAVLGNEAGLFGAAYLGFEAANLKSRTFAVTTT